MKKGVVNEYIVVKMYLIQSEPGVSFLSLSLVLLLPPGKVLGSKAHARGC